MSTSSRKESSRRQFVILAGAGAVGCAALGCSFRRPYDGQSVDLRGFNLVDPDDETIDLSAAPRDFAQPRDLREPPPPDFAGRDLSGVDLTRPPDLTQLPDLTTPPDMAMPPDMACGGEISLPDAESIPLSSARFYPALDPTHFDLLRRTGTIVARDAQGWYAMVNACRHSGCPVRFNAGALTFDCPCHGSRYRFNGAVLMGPAVDPLFHRPLCRLPDGRFVADATRTLSGLNGRTP